MASKVNLESDLYPGMSVWLKDYLTDMYKFKKCEIFVIDAHSQYLDVVLQNMGVLKYKKHIVGLKIQIDILGVVKFKNSAKLYFIEAKKTPLTLQNLGQLLIYCKLCDPEEAFLLSSAGLGSLEKVIKNLKREDLLDFGIDKKIRKIRIARWDNIRNTVDQHSLIPKV